MGKIMKKNSLKSLLVVLCVAFGISGCGSTAGRSLTSSGVESEKDNKEDDKEKDNEEQKDKEKNDKKKDDKKKDDKKQDDKEKDNNDKADKEDDDKKNSDKGNESAVDRAYKVPLNGVMMYIPRTYHVSVYEEDSIMLIEGDYNFEMRLLVRDESYEDELSNLDSLTEKLKDSGVTIVEDIKEGKINGKSYAYCTYKDDEADDTLLMLAYTAGAGDKRIGMNIAINSEMSDVEVLEQIDEFLHNTEQTDEPDVTEDDLLENMHVSDGEAVDHAQITLGNASYTIKVPSNFYYVDSSNLEDSSYLMFESEFLTIDVNTIIRSKLLAVDAEQYIKEEAELDYDNMYSTFDLSEIKKKEVNGNTVYYLFVSYTDDEDNVYNRFYAACNLPDGALYIVEAYSINEKDELTWELFEDFMHIE